MRAQMLSELRDVVNEIKRAPSAQGPKDHFEILVRQMTSSERQELRGVLIDMVTERDDAVNR